MSSKTRSKTSSIDPNWLFTDREEFLHPIKLPTLKSVIGVMRHLMSGGTAQMTLNEAAREVAKRVHAKWYHDTVYTISLTSIAERLMRLWNTFKEGRKRFYAGRLDSKAVKVILISFCFIKIYFNSYCRNTSLRWPIKRSNSLMLPPRLLSKSPAVRQTGVCP